MARLLSRQMNYANAALATSFFVTLSPINLQCLWPLAVGMTIIVDNVTDISSWFLSSKSSDAPRSFSNLLVYRVNDSVAVSFNSGWYLTRTVFDVSCCIFSKLDQANKNSIAYYSHYFDHDDYLLCVESSFEREHNCNFFPRYGVLNYQPKV